MDPSYFNAGTDAPKLQVFSPIYCLGVFVQRQLKTDIVLHRATCVHTRFAAAGTVDPTNCLEMHNNKAGKMIDSVF